MKQLLEESEFDAFRQRCAAGEVSLAIRPNVARQFFTRVPETEVRGKTGQSTFVPRAVVLACIGLCAVLLLAGLASIAWYFGLAAIVAIPVTGVLVTVIAGLTSDKGDVRHTAAAALLLMVLAATLPVHYLVPTLLFGAGIIANRCSYMIARKALESLVLSSWTAYDMLVDHIEITENTPRNAT